MKRIQTTAYYLLHAMECVFHSRQHPIYRRTSTINKNDVPYTYIFLFDQCNTRSGVLILDPHPCFLSGLCKI
jgi:hypothetical protein